MQELRRIRKEQGLTQRELATASGVDPATISLVENGKRRPHLETLDSLAAVLGVEVVELLGKAQAPLPLEYEQSEAAGRLAKVPEVLGAYIFARVTTHDDEVREQDSPHFRTSTSATLWLASVEEEAAAWADWASKEVVKIMPVQQQGSTVGNLVGTAFDVMEIMLALFGFDNVKHMAERRIKTMTDVPDELSARRLEVAAARAEESQKRLAELAAASG